MRLNLFCCLVAVFFANHVNAQSTLTTIRHFTNIGAYVDINLSQLGIGGACRLRRPNGVETDLSSSAAIAGVNVQSSSKFVSCRVIIGPMTEALLGDWTLIEQGTALTREQPVTISWADNNNPNAQARQLILNGKQSFKENLGSTVEAILRRETGLFEGCFIIAPDGTTMPLSSTTDYPGILWSQRSNGENICHAALGPIDADMIGRWSMFAWFIHDGVRIETHQPIRIEEEDGISMLPALEYLTHIGESIDVSLNRTGVSGTCVLRDPAGQEYTLVAGDTTIPGVTVRNADRYVLCLVTIGPMEQSLLGEWTLIQQNADTTQRRQPVAFGWANPLNPEAESWTVATHIPRTVSTTIGGTVEISIDRLEGFFEGCFLTRPDGITLPIYGRNYPGIAHVLSNRISVCIIELGPLDTEMVGTWVLSARHESLGMMLETRQPYIVARDDGTTVLPRIRHWTHIGETIEINLSQTGTSAVCRLRSPAGIEYNVNAGTSPVTGVTVHSSNKFVSCRVTIGPMTESLLGEWVLIEQRTGQIRRQPAVIAWAHPGEPSAPSKQFIIAAEETFPIELQQNVEVAVSREMGAWEGCTLTLPDGTIIPILGHLEYPYISFIYANRLLGCVIEIGPVESDMLGRYTLSGVYNNIGVRTESQQSFTIQEDDGITYMPPAYHITNIGATVDINLSQNGTTGTCLLRNPAGTTFILDNTFSLSGVTVHRSSKFVSCRVTIGPMTANHLGDWTLMHQSADQRERRIHANIRWANPANPNQPARQVISAAEQNAVGTFGETVTITVPWSVGFFEGCTITAPDGTVIPVTPNHVYPGITWSRFNSMWSCTAILGPIDDEMVGTWILASNFDDDGSLLESQQPMTLTRNSAAETELPLLEYTTNVGALVDINTDRTDKNIESCRLLTPSGELHIIDETFNLDAVTPHNSNKFAGCRVTIGPMTEALLGRWTLIEHNTDQTHRRQSVSLTWAFPNNPTAVPSLMIAAQQNIAADTGEVVQVFLSRESGLFEGCFITTPDGATLPLFPLNRYPGITHAGINRLTACFVDLGPMDSEMEGLWTLFARFSNDGARIESQLPISVTLNDGRITLPLLHQPTFIGDYIDINLNQTDVSGNCHLVTPDGQDYSLNTATGIAGVTVRPSSKFVSCRVTIGPMVESLLGDWTLYQELSDQTRRTQPVSIVWGNPSDPSTPRGITTESQQTFQVSLNTVISTSISNEVGVTEGCFITTPDGSILPIRQNLDFPGVRWAGVNRITACFIQLGPVDADMVGRWTLVARTNNHGVRTELQQPIQIGIADALTTDTLVKHFHYTHIGGFVDISLNETGTIGDRPCKLRDPAGRDFLIDSNLIFAGVTIRSKTKYVSCGVTIGPMTQELLGSWALIQQDSDTNQRIQEADIAWTNANDPTEVRRLVNMEHEDIVLDPDVVLAMSVSNLDQASGFIFEGCVIRTNDGTNLPMTTQNRYPGIVHAGYNRITACFIDIGPITEEMEGLWILSALFRLNGERLESQVQARVRISDGTETLPLIEHVTNEGGIIDLSLNQTGVAGTCLLLAPSGEEYTMSSAATLTGVTVHGSSKFVSCRVTLGPMTEELLGDWTIIQMLSDTTIRQQPATIAWNNPDDTLAEVREVRTAPEIDIFGDYGSIIEIHIARENHIFEGCFITTPDETVLPIFPTIRYPGIAHVGINRLTACFLELGPVDEPMVGKWVLAARFNDNGARIETQLPFNLTIGQPPTRINVTALVVCLTLLFAMVFAAVGVLSFKRSRDWSTQRFERLRSSFRRSISRAPIVSDHEMGSRG